MRVSTINKCRLFFNSLQHCHKQKHTKDNQTDQINLVEQLWVVSEAPSEGATLKELIKIVGRTLMVPLKVQIPDIFDVTSERRRFLGFRRVFGTHSLLDYVSVSLRD